MTDSASGSFPPVDANPRLAAALTYARLGWPVLALKPRSKKPLGSLVPHGLLDATTAVEILRGWWERIPHANVGIRTGGTGGIVALDVDPKHGGDESLVALEQRHGPVPRTVEAVTGGGGRHLIFAYPLDGLTIPNAAPLAGLPGLDLRGDGGYIVAPPSVHPNGSEYRWPTGSGPGQVALAQLPHWLLPLARGAGPASGQTPCLEAGQGERIPQGRRNTTLTSLAGAMRRRGMTEAEMQAALQKVNQDRCHPPLLSGEVSRIARSVGRYTPAGILVSPPEGDRRGNSANSANIANGSPPPEPAAWEPPIPFQEFDPPQFPTETLPRALREFVEAEAEATQTPPDLPALMCLAACSVACARKVVVQVRGGYREPVNLYTVVVLAPANRKSAVVADVAAPLEEYEREECLRLRPEVAGAQARRKIAEGAARKAQERAAEADPAEREELTREAIQRARELSTLRVPVEPRLLAEDATPERLATLLHEQCGRMAVTSAEGGIFDLMAGRYSMNAAPNYEVYLKAHPGDTLRVDRASRPPEHVERPALTLGLAVQPEVLRGLMDKAGFRGRGLLGRFLYSLPESPLGRRRINPPPVRPEARAAYHRLVRTLLELPFRTDDEGNRAEHVLHLDPDAASRLQEFEEWLEPQLAEHGDLGDITDWAGKLAGGIARIAGLLHMAETVDQARPWVAPIGLSTMENAIRIGQYLIPHARAAYARMGADPEVEDAKYLLRWIMRAGRGRFTKREAFEGTKGRFRRVKALEPPLKLLVEHDCIRVCPGPGRSGPGRPRSATYDVNPHLYSQNSHNSQNSGPGTDSANIANSAKPETDLTPDPPPCPDDAGGRERFSL